MLNILFRPQHICFLIIIFLFLSENVLAEEFKIEQKILFQFEEMLYNNWEGTGFNYVSGSARFIGDYRKNSDDSTFKIINHVEGALGVAYNETDKWKIQEDKISATSSLNQKLTGDLFANGTADLKTQFLWESAYLLGAIGVSYIHKNLTIQENPFTIRWVVSKNDSPKWEYGNYFRLTWKDKLDTNITLAVKLENFYQYGNVWLKESYWNMESIMTFQINKIISSHLIVNLLLDPVQSKRLQAWEKITIGITWQL